jgi:serine protease Do
MMRIKWVWCGLVAAGMIGVWGIQPACAQSSKSGAVATLKQMSEAYADIAERVKPSVVSIHSEKIMRFRQREFLPFDEDTLRRFFGDNLPFQLPPQREPRQREYRVPQRGVGSGILIDKEGHVLTNHHVVDDVDEISVTLADKRQFKATVVGSDPKTDLAILKLRDAPKDLPVAALGDSDALRVGDWVLAFGAPFGYEQTVTTGIISAKGRGNVGIIDGGYEDFLQTDAAINPGNSGGPLVNLDGKVIGINTAIATPIGQSAGVGFAIPINMAKGIMADLLRDGKVTRGFLGIVIQDLDDELAKQFQLSHQRGALVAQVNDGSPADKAGIRVGDVILKFNGKTVEDTQNLRNMAAGTVPGTKVDVVLQRDGKERTVKVEVGAMPGSETASRGRDDGPSAKDTDLGITVETLSTANAKELGYEGEKGVVVTSVDESGPAAGSGLQAGDLIVEVNRQKVDDVKSYREAVAKSGEKGAVLMLVKRQGASRFVIVRTK